MEYCRDDKQNTLIQDKSAPPGNQFDFLIGRAFCTWLPAICVVVECHLESSPPSFVGELHSTAIISGDRGDQAPIDIRHIERPLLPLQTVLPADRQGSGRPQVTSTWPGAALTTWPGSLGQIMATQN